MTNYFVYFIGPELGDTKYRDTNMLKGEYYYPFKIGVSKDPSKRLKQLQTSNFVKLEIIFVEGPFTKAEAFNKELELHKVLKTINSVGEWFKLQYFSYLNILPVIKPLIKNDIDLLGSRITEKKNRVGKEAQISDQILRFRTNLWQMKKLYKCITYKMFWQLIDTTEYFPLSRKDRILIFLREYKVSCISDIISSD